MNIRPIDFQRLLFGDILGKSILLYAHIYIQWTSFFLSFFLFYFLFFFFFCMRSFDPAITNVGEMLEREVAIVLKNKHFDLLYVVY